MPIMVMDLSMKKLRLILWVVLAVGLGMAVATGEQTMSFKECYTKCFIFCMIEPNQTLCSCTTHCLKDCIFQGIQNQGLSDHDQPHSDNLRFCKLGCAFSTCSAFSAKHKPNGDKVDGCVGSCSNKCVNSYQSRSP